MSFSSPLVLIALLAIPVLIAWYVGQQRRRAQAAEAFVAPALTRSVAPKRPGWRRHVPMIAFALALAILIVAAARPQRTKAVPITQRGDHARQRRQQLDAGDRCQPVAAGGGEAGGSTFVASVPSRRSSA